MLFPQERRYRNQMPRNDFMFPNRANRQMPQRNNHITGMLQQFMGQHQNMGQMASRGVEGLSKTLNGVQQVLRVVDTAAPIVKQYGPLVRNLPAMYRLMKAFKSMETTEEESTSLESLESLTSSTESEEEILIDRTKDGQSRPKLFI
ncbi:VrrA/YqfQ family protein [Ornithinibacillus halotolerans]|uniref:YqfQ-like protein n=1 Tax=Ornithinibacillus halotolerans TaxID=1274357 RepID=A0A916RPS9_9BACI|nr:VrrA/YqfQ family protein [Ornithinibacillus halotolerans]GGA61771.1 hypothetical protein GCM10008025_02150 [Ornithinibacillus halotolerans]